MASSRESILAKIRAQQVPRADLPELAREDWIRYADPADQFCEVLSAVGGRAVRVPDHAGVAADLGELAVFQAAQRICSLVPEAVAGNVELAEVADAHLLADVDFALLPGEFAVAENGAVWLTDRQIRHRVVCFITQHLAVVVPADQVVDNMHDAYARLGLGPGAGPGYGLFMAGPSKTADIEQSLVIGAHGARSLTVYLVG